MVNGKGCKFCSVGKTFLVHSPQEVAETALVAFNQDSHYQVCLGGGVKIVPNNFNYFLSCVQEIRKLNSTVKIWIEMVPPSNNTDIQDMIDAGANGFGFNLEIWDDTIRKEVFPGKSAITKQRYFEAWEYVQKQLGQNRVNTALLTGLEPYESTEQGIYEITKQGVRITLLPFKPWDGSVYESREPSDPEKHFQLAYTLAEQMKKYNVIPEMNLGCANCESCTIEDNILHYIQDNA
jgi:biotin synthase-related radical SAM superfamily protein